MIEYRIDFYDPKGRKYRTGWVGREEYAAVMFNKPYNQLHTRRLVKTETTILAKAKAGKRW